MILRRSRAALLSASIFAVPVALSPVLTTPAAAQWVVYDPTNYAQNVLQAARALQQINNQITSLQNEAQSLIIKRAIWPASPTPRCSSFNSPCSGPSSS